MYRISLKPYWPQGSNCPNTDIAFIYKLPNSCKNWLNLYLQSMPCSPAGFEWAHVVSEPRRAFIRLHTWSMKRCFILALGSFEAQTQREQRGKEDTSSGRSEHQDDVLPLQESLP